MRWLILALYAAGWLWFVPWWARRTLNRWERITTGDRWAALLVASVVAWVWPVVMVGYAVRKAPDRFLRTDAEIGRERDAELRRLRALARQYNLPMGDEK